MTGSEIYYSEDGKGKFVFQKGPIFGNLILADEINRAPAKVQAALLEAMEERQVTVAGSTYKPATETHTGLASGASYNSITNGSNKYVGSLTVEASSGGQIVVIVNQIWPAASGDQFMTYNGFNY